VEWFLKNPETSTHTPQLHELRQAALHCLAERDIYRKVEVVAMLVQAYTSGTLELDTHTSLTTQQTIPGHPDKPELVSPHAVQRRSMKTPEGRAILIHALAHIEFNAINLALDAIWRFADMPEEYYEDWLKVADEEALHFSLLNGHLQARGFAYGDFPAHNGLWEMAVKTRHDILARIALVPRTMEARGLDVTPQIRAKFAQVKDLATTNILDFILRDEIGHVAIGNRWYNWLCEQRRLDPIITYEKLTEEYSAPAMRRPFNMDARRSAGFSEFELQRFNNSA